jgi:2TM domain
VLPGSDARTFRVHAWAFVAGNVALSVANWLTGRPWWAFWPLLLWGVVLGIHFLVHKTHTVDDEWVAARTAELHAKSYDVSHIDSIAERSGEGALAPRADPTATPRE